MNILRLWRIYRTSQRLATYLEEARVSKSLFTSKTFWFNVLSAAAELTNILPLPPGTVILVTNLINIALRVVTDKAVHVLPK